MKVVQIFKNGDMCDLDCKFTKKNILKTLTGNSKSNGNNSIKLLYTWNIQQYKLLCYGWYEGEHGFENKHDLPPSGVSSFIDNDSSEQLLFGDIFIVRMQKDKYLSIDISEYSDYYNILFGGFEDCESEDSELVYSEEELINENESEEEEEFILENFNSEEELEMDSMDY